MVSIRSVGIGIGFLFAPALHGADVAVVFREHTGESNQFAFVVLPATAWPEKVGTVTASAARARRALLK